MSVPKNQKDKSACLVLQAAALSRTSFFAASFVLFNYFTSGPSAPLGISTPLKNEFEATIINAH